ncbi:MAG: hypothetical protein DRG78_11670 [Epsilonproteobacteria bacterium]|nr:MAG: hypothetical protein DRG78_11670 [Campylobacterota bacterium]
MNYIFRLNNKLDGFEDIEKAYNYFRNILPKDNKNFFYHVNQLRQLKTDKHIFFAYNGFIIASAKFKNKFNVLKEERFKVGHLLSDIKILYVAERLNTKIIGPRGTYLNNKNKIAEIKRVLNSEYTIKNITNNLNKFSKNHEIGKLQIIRKNLLKKKRKSTTIFTNKTITKDWAFHYGGRKELQFNIGYEQNGMVLRVGVAFSLQKSKALPNKNILLKKVQLFNQYIKEYKDELTNFEMWYYRNNSRSINSEPFLIEDSLFKDGNFIFLGKTITMASLKYETILTVMDDLLPLYIFTMGGNINTAPKNKFLFKKGNRKKKASTKISSSQKELNITLRHNIMQESLYNQLCELYGKDNVGTENNVHMGKVDLVVKHNNNEYWFYEIKTYNSVKLCLRESIGQLLEYAYWYDNKIVTKLIVVGTSKLDMDSTAYIKLLNNKFNLHLTYISIKIER